MLEIDVDVRRLAALGADEALEQQAAADRVDGGDAEDVADGGVGRRAAPLAKDVLRARISHDAADGEEIRRVVKVGDQPQFVPELGRHVVREPVRITQLDAFPHQPLQSLLRCQGRVIRLVWVLVAQLGQRERAAFDDFERTGERVRVAREQPPHLVRRLEMAVGKTFAAKARVVDRAAFADAGDHVLQDAAVRRVIQHVAGRHGADAGGARSLRQVLQSHGVARMPPQGQGQVRAVAEIAAQPGEMTGESARPVRQQHGKHPRAVFDEIVPVETTGALARALLADAEQPAQPRIGRFVRRVDQHGAAVGEVEPAADDQAHAGFVRTLISAHDSGERVAIDHAERRQSQQLGLQKQFLHMARATEKAVVGRDLEFGVAGHEPAGGRRS